MYLRFIGGQFEGGEFPLKPNREVTIGRGSENDMVLDEDMVSRSHARILTFDGKTVIRDDGSTNGTLVNGERVAEKILNEGDQILIGQSLLEFVSAGKSKGLATQPPQQAHRTAAETMVANVGFLSGKLSETSTTFLELVEEIHKAKATGIFVVKHGAEGDGNLVFNSGQLLRVSLSLSGKNALELPSRKAFLRIMLWKVGRYKFDLETPVPPIATDMNLSQLLDEARTEVEMFETFAEFLPSLDASLRINLPLHAKLSELSAEALDTLQLVMNHGQVRRVVDQGLASDFEIFQDILYLLQNGYVSQT